MKRLEIPAPRPAEGYPLQDPAEPNLLPAIFPPGQPPRVAFDGRLLAPQPPMDIWIADATFRCAAPGGAGLYPLLHRLGGPRGVIRQTEFPLGTEAERESLRKLLEARSEFPEPTGWIRGDPEEVAFLEGLRLKETGLPLPVSDFRIFGEARRTRKEAFRRYLEDVDRVLGAGIVARCHLEDVTRADLYGFVVPLARELMKRAREAEVPVKIRLCDSLGLAVVHAGAAPPRSVQRLVHAMAEEAEVPSEWLEWEGRGEMGLASSSAAWMSGCAVAVGSLGLPVTSLEALLREYAGLKGDLSGVNLAALSSA